MKKISFNIIANAVVGHKGLSGGDNIFINFAKQLKKRAIKVNIFTWKHGYLMCKRNGLTKKDVNFFLSSAGKFEKWPFSLLYLLRTILGIWEVKKAIKMNQSENGEVIIYSASDFWPDSLPAFFFKKWLPQAKWVAGFYLFAPKPWQKESPYKGKSWFRGFIYWLFQLPIYWLVKNYADMVFVTSEPDVEKFVTKKRSKDKIVVIRGGVDIKPSEEYLSSGRVLPLGKRKYDACFIGRFHPQKGVIELIDIWKLVCQRIPKAKLVMIGDGPLEKEVREKIQKLNLWKNVELVGFKDGEEKYEIFKQSKIVVHPATYDSGGMAACEAMAWGLPGVSFDLEALKTYYPKGMLKTPCYNLEKFSENIVLLLTDKELYKITSQEAIFWARGWDWDKRADEILMKLINFNL